MIFDSHAHYDDEAFDLDRNELLSSLPNKNVYAVINVGTNINTSQKAVDIAKKYSYIYAAVGFHPECILDLEYDEINSLEALAKQDKVLAIGEIGLDYHYDGYDKEKQIMFFEKQLELANELNLPVLIHDREAHQDTLYLLKKYKPKGVVHCFSGSLEMANEILKLGMFIGIGGVVTFKNAKKLVEVVNGIPLESILLETDAPYLAPVPFRGKRCDSSYIQFTAQKIAEIKNVSYEYVLEQTKNNAIEMFGLGGN